MVNKLMRFFGQIGSVILVSIGAAVAGFVGLLLVVISTLLSAAPFVVAAVIILAILRYMGVL